VLERDFPLGVGDFRYQDLHREDRLAELDAYFLSELDREDPAVGSRLRAYRAEPAAFDPLSRSKLLVDAGRFVGAFVARLFGVEREWQAQIEIARPEAVLFRFRRDFLQRRASKVALPDLASEAAEEIAARGRALERDLHPELPWDRDPELATALLGTGLIDLEADFLAALKQKKVPEVPRAARERAILLAERAAAIPGGLGLPAPGEADEELLAFVEALLKSYALWTAVRRAHPLWRREVREWASFRLPETLNYSALVAT